MLQIRRGCERNVITYSSLISACEKAGRWELALDLFGEMHREGCKPNVVTYNSLIAACAQGIPSSAYHAAEHVQATGGCHLSLLKNSDVLILVANNIHMSTLTMKNLLRQLHASNVHVALSHLISSINLDIIMYFLSILNSTLWIADYCVASCCNPPRSCKLQQDQPCNDSSCACHTVLSLFQVHSGKRQLSCSTRCSPRAASLTR